MASSSYLDSPERGGTGNYFKAKVPGEYTVRVLADFIPGELAWKGKKPVRKRTGESWVEDDCDDVDKIKTIWMGPVWNYAEEKVQVWEIAQKGIRAAIRSLVKKKAWGPITGYDLVLERKGTGIDDTEYLLVPENKGPAPDAAIKAFEDACAFGKFNIEELFYGGDPFDAKLRGKDGVEDKDIPF